MKRILIIFVLLVLFTGLGLAWGEDRQPFDGLIIDARETGFRPALVNTIWDNSGLQVYAPDKLDRNILIENGCGEYTASIEEAKGQLRKRGVNNPLVVNANMTKQNFSGIIIGEDEAHFIREADSQMHFLSEAKVAFVFSIVRLAFCMVL